MTTCTKGLHEMNEGNTKLDRHGRKHCRACIRERKSGYHKGSQGVGRHYEGTFNKDRTAMDKALDANPPTITWEKKRGGIWVATSVKDPHAETAHQRKRDQEFYADLDIYFVPPEAVEPECTDENLLTAARTEI